MTDKSTTLVSGCIKGDRKSQNELYEILYPILSNTCRQYCKVKEDIEDVTAEVFVRIFMNLGKYRGKSMTELVGWCKTIAKRRAIDKVNAGMTNKRRGFNVGYDDIYGEQPSVRNTASPDSERIVALMADMPKKPRIVFAMREIEGYTYSELTVILGMSINALKVNYHRARKWLMARIEADSRMADTRR